MSGREFIGFNMPCVHQVVYELLRGWQSLSMAFDLTSRNTTRTAQCDGMTAAKFNQHQRQVWKGKIVFFWGGGKTNRQRGEHTLPRYRTISKTPWCAYSEVTSLTPCSYYCIILSLHAASTSRLVQFSFLRKRCLCFSVGLNNASVCAGGIVYVYYVN